MACLAIKVFNAKTRRKAGEEVLVGVWTLRGLMKRAWRWQGFVKSCRGRCLTDL